jgi:hypothetical protein
MEVQKFVATHLNAIHNLKENIIFFVVLRSIVQRKHIVELFFSFLIKYAVYYILCLW